MDRTTTAAVSPSARLVVEPSPAVEPSTEHRNKRARFRELLNPDLKVVVGAGESKKTFDVHALHLMQSSKYFSALLSSEHWSKDTIELSDEDPTEFEVFYKSLTVASAVTLSTTESFAVAKLSNKYDVPQLKDKCETSIVNAKVENGSLHFALTHNLHRRAAFIVEQMIRSTITVENMSQLAELAVEDCSEGGKQLALLKKLWIRLCRDADLGGLPMPASTAGVRSLWPFLTARLMPVTTDKPSPEAKYEKTLLWLDELEPSKWPPSSRESGEYASLIKHLWPMFCQKAGLEAPATACPRQEVLLTMWPFMRSTILHAGYPEAYKQAVAEVAPVLEKMKEWPDQLFVKLPAYPKRLSGSPDEEARNFMRQRVNEVLQGSLGKLGKSGEARPPVPSRGFSADSSDPDSD